MSGVGGADAADLSVDCSDLSVAERDGGRRVLEGLTFRVPRGGVLAVSGPSGSGKSVLAALLAGRAGAGFRIDGGSAVVEGLDLRRSRPASVHSVVGYVGQGDGAGLEPRMTVSEIVAEPLLAGRRLRSRSAYASAAALMVATALDEVGLALGAAGKYPYELSAGMRQRVVIARVLVRSPRLLVADDLMANLDLDGRRLAAAAVTRRIADGMAALLAGDDIEPVGDGAPRLVLRRGRTVAFGRDGHELWTPDQDGA